MSDTMRTLIKEMLTEAKTLKFSGQNRQDLEMARLWLQNNGKLTSSSSVKIADNMYVLTVRVKGNPSDAIDLVKDRFGSFIRVDGQS